MIFAESWVPRNSELKTRVNCEDRLEITITMGINKNFNDANTRQMHIQETYHQDPQPSLQLPSRNKVEEPSNIAYQMTRREGSRFFNKFFQILYYIHFFLITILVIFLTIRGILSAARTRRFHPEKWYPQILASTACAGVVGFLWQAFVHASPARTMKAAFWLSPLLTCAVGILFILIGTPGSLAAAAIALVSAVIQSLYSCWVNPRIEYAIRVLSVSIAFPPPNTTVIMLLSMIISTLHSCILMSGIGGATASGTRFDKLFIFLILLSLAWTMHIIKNTLQVATSYIKYMQFASGIDVETNTAFTNTFSHSMGSICIGSVLVPVLGAIRSSARAISSVSGDVDEFMFSCASCYSAVAATLVTYANRWGFVHVGVYGKGIVQASRDTWEMFRRVGIEQLINTDLTSSLCFLCGVAGGAVCALLGGSWSLVIHTSNATELSIYAFIVGYFTTRVAMAWPQASVSAYYAAYAENPLGQRFDSTIPVRIQQLQRIQA